MEEIGKMVKERVKQRIVGLDKALELNNQVLEVLFQFNGLPCSKNKRNLEKQLQAIDPNFIVEVKKRTSYGCKYVLIISYIIAEGEVATILHLGMYDNIINFSYIADDVKQHLNGNIYQRNKQKYILDNFSSIASNFNLDTMGSSIDISFHLDMTDFNYK